MVQSSLFKDIKPVRFYRSGSGREPVREWLRRLPRSDRKAIGRDVMTLQPGWPRVIFTVHGDSILLLHGFVKKSGKTPLRDLRVARQRMEKL